VAFFIGGNYQYEKPFETEQVEYKLRHKIH